MPSPRWEEFANYNPCYAQWLDRIDMLCSHFLDISFFDLVSLGELDPMDAHFHSKLSPEEFFKGAVIPYIENAHGADFIYEHIADNVMWGACAPGVTTT